MRVPEVLTALADQGVIDEVLRPLKSGKEAQVYLVLSEGEQRVAKVYKESLHRSFKQRAQYTEGRRVRNTRDQRAIDRRTRHGKAQEESSWKSAEVNVIYQLHRSGVRVPTPYNFIDGVLIMELVRDSDGLPAPRLGELALDPETARAYFDQLLREVVRMLCAGIVHGDLSDFNVLVDAKGPVVIDFPQAVDASANRNAKKLLVRDVNNLSAFLGRTIPNLKHRPYGEEIWAAFERNTLTPEMELTGTFARSKTKVNTEAVLDQIMDADRDEEFRREARGEAPIRARRREIVLPAPDKDKATKKNDGSRGRPNRRKGKQSGNRKHRSSRRPIEPARGKKASPKKASPKKASPKKDSPKKDSPKKASPKKDGPPKRRRRRRRGGSGSGDSGSAPAGQPSPRHHDGRPSKPNRGKPNQGRRPPKTQEATPASTEQSADPAKPRRRRRRRPRGKPSSEGGAPPKSE